MTTIREITEISNKGYIDDPERVGTIVEKVVNMPVARLFEGGAHEIRGVFDALVKLRNFPKEVLDGLTYIEMLGLIEDIPDYTRAHVGTSFGRDKEITPESFMRFHVRILKRALLEAAKSDLLIAHFLGIEAKALFDYLESRHNDQSLGKMYEVMASSRNGMKIPGNLSWLLKDTTDRENSSWKCWKDIEKYRVQILRANSWDCDLLVYGFCQAYRERIAIPVLVKKCWALEKDLRVKEKAKNMQHSNKEKEGTSYGTHN